MLTAYKNILWSLGRRFGSILDPSKGKQRAARVVSSNVSLTQRNSRTWRARRFFPFLFLFSSLDRVAPSFPPVFTYKALSESFCPRCADALHRRTALVINLRRRGDGDLLFNFFFIVCVKTISLEITHWALMSVPSAWNMTLLPSRSKKHPPPPPHASFSKIIIIIIYFTKRWAK